MYLFSLRNCVFDFCLFSIHFEIIFHSKMEDGDFDQRLRDLQREYLEFLDDEVSYCLVVLRLCSAPIQCKK